MNEKAKPAAAGPVDYQVRHHSPGPWRWEAGQKGHCNLVASDGTVILKARGEDRLPTDDDIIAAAPDLLAALRNFVEGCSTTVDAGAAGRAAIANALSGDA